MRRRLVAIFAAILVVSGLVCVLLFIRALSPVGAGRRGYVRIEQLTSRAEVLEMAQSKGYVRSASALDLLARLTGRPATVGIGTYRFFSDLGGPSNLAAIFHPVVQRVRLPETNWAKRTANVLEKKEVCSAADYMAEVLQPQVHKPTSRFVQDPRGLPLS